MTQKLEKILIVDDEEDTAALVTECLRRRGYDTTYVTSGSRCLECLSTNRVDVVITDMQMPGMSGLELCAQLREHYPDCMSIVLTGHGTGDAAVHASRAGAFDFMTKPARIDALENAITRALEHRRARVVAP